MYIFHMNTYNREFEYSPKMTPEDFIRNNELSDLEIRDMDWIKNIMIELYKKRIDENF